MNELLEIARALADLLARENAALAALDFAAATAAAQGKRALAEQFAQASVRTARDGALDRARLAPVAREVAELALENRRLLERAVTVQNRVVASVVRAIPKPRAGGQQYGAQAAHAARRAMAPVALSARA